MKAFNYYCHIRIAHLIIGLFSFLFLSQISRAETGRPYFQQKVDCDISVFLQTESKVITGTISVSYLNNSTDTLSEIYFHLYPNAYADRNSMLSKQQLRLRNTRAFFAKDNQRGYIDSLDFECNGIQLNWDYVGEDNTISKVKLKVPLLPGDSLKITTPFKVKLPDASISRMGYEKDSYYITQWFPKPAVYDNNGWHYMPYLEQGEYYSEYGNYKVNIICNKEFDVISTGNLIEQTVFNVTNKKDSNIVEFKKYIFESSNIHDFAWVATSELKINEGKLLLKSGKEIKFQIGVRGYNEFIWTNAKSYLIKSLNTYSELFGEYPYDKISLIDAGSISGVNMEYPALILIGDQFSEFSLEDVIAHEVAHMWNYAALGFNERDEPWLDEGLSTFFEMVYFQANYSLEDLKGRNNLITAAYIDKFTKLNTLNIIEGYQLQYLKSVREGNELPASFKSDDHTQNSYYNSVYLKTGLSFFLLREWLGSDLFDLCFNKFYNSWKYKHPKGEDLINYLEECTGKELDFFMNELINSSHIADIGIISEDANGFVITSDTDSSKLPVRAYLSNDKSIWKSIGDTITRISTESTISSVSVEPYPLPDPYPHNNTINNSGQRTKPLKVQFGTSPGLGKDQRSAYILPTIGYNDYNSFMAGVVIHNHALIPKKLEFNLIPLVDFKNSNIAGVGNVLATWQNVSSIFKQVEVSADVARFAYEDEFSDDVMLKYGNSPLLYNRIGVGVNLYTKLDKYFHRSTWLNVNYQAVYRELIEYDFIENNYVPERNYRYFGFSSLSYNHRNDRAIDPFSAMIKLENESEYLKAAFEFKYRFSFAKKDKGLDIRFHLGKFIYNNEDEFNYNFRMDGWSGSNDYLYDDFYFGRNRQDGLWSRQFILKDGGFKTPTAVGQSNNWNSALNIYLDNPTPLPIRFFIDIGTYDGIQDVYADINNLIMYDAGIMLSFFKGGFEVYLPLFVSADIDKYYETNDIGFGDRIRFVLDIKKFNPVQLRKLY